MSNNSICYVTSLPPLRPCPSHPTGSKFGSNTVTKHEGEKTSIFHIQRTCAAEQRVDPCQHREVSRVIGFGKGCLAHGWTGVGYEEHRH